MTEIEDLLDQLSPYGRSLATGEEAGKDDWSTTCSIAAACFRAEFDLDEYLAVIDASPVASGSDGRRLRNSRKLTRAEKAWHWATENVSTDTDVRTSIADLVRRINEAQWRGRSGPTDHAVALAVADLAFEIGAYSDLRLDVRGISLRAGVGRGSVGRGLYRLAELKLITRRTPASKGAGFAARYDLDLNWRKSWYLASSQTAAYRERMTHPAFLRGALGMTAGFVFEAVLLAASPPTVRELSLAVGQTPRSVQRAARILVDAGVLVSTGRPPRFDLTSDAVYRLDVAAKDAGSHDWVDRTTEVYARHREADQLQRQLRRHSGTGSIQGGLTTCPIMSSQPVVSAYTPSAEDLAILKAGLADGRQQEAELRRGRSAVHWNAVQALFDEEDD